MTRNEQIITFINTISSHIDELKNRYNRFLNLRTQAQKKHDAIHEANLYIYTESLCDLINILCIEQNKELYTIRNLIFLSGRMDLTYQLNTLFNSPLDKKTLIQRRSKDSIILCVKHFHGENDFQQSYKESLQCLINKEYPYNIDYIVANILNYTKQGLHTLYAGLSTSRRIYGAYPK